MYGEGRGWGGVGRRKKKTGEGFPHWVIHVLGLFVGWLALVWKQHARPGNPNCAVFFFVFFKSDFFFLKCCKKTNSRNAFLAPKILILFRVKRSARRILWIFSPKAKNATRPSLRVRPCRAAGYLYSGQIRPIEIGLKCFKPEAKPRSIWNRKLRIIDSCHAHWLVHPYNHFLNFIRQIQLQCQNYSFSHSTTRLIHLALFHSNMWLWTEWKLKVAARPCIGRPDGL